MHIVILFLSWGKKSRDVAEVNSACNCSTHSFMLLVMCSPRVPRFCGVGGRAFSSTLLIPPFFLYASPCAAITFCWKSCTGLLSAILAYTKSYPVLFLKGCFSVAFNFARLSVHFKMKLFTQGRMQQIVRRFSHLMCKK